MGSADPPGKMDKKLKSENMQKKRAVFLCSCYILRAIRAGRCRERRYADHIFIQIYFRMHHFVVRFSKFSSPQAARGIDPPNQNPADVPDDKYHFNRERKCADTTGTVLIRWAGHFQC